MLFFLVYRTQIHIGCEFQVANDSVGTPAPSRYACVWKNGGSKVRENLKVGKCKKFFRRKYSFLIHPTTGNLFFTRSFSRIPCVWWLQGHSILFVKIWIDLTHVDA